MSKKMAPKQLFAESAGWYGAVAILVAYALVSFKIIPGDGLAFQLLNLTGALGILTISLYKKVKQSIVLNIFWGAVAIVAIAAIIIS